MNILRSCDQHPLYYEVDENSLNFRNVKIENFDS